MSGEASIDSAHNGPARADWAEADGDLKLMQCIAQGSESSLAELLTTHQDSVRSFVGRLTAWHTDVDDIVQEVFIRAWRNAHQFRVAGSVRGWLFQIALQRCRYHRRTEVRLLKRLVQLFQQRDHGTTPATEVEDPRWQLIQDAMARLSYADRELLVRVYMAEESIQAIAEQTGVKDATLHVRMHRAKQRLIQQIERTE